jgi:hypothetical protein
MSRQPDRDAAIIRAVKAGATLQAAADRHGLTRERVRQICAAAGVQAKGRPAAKLDLSPTKGERREITRACVSEAVMTGSTVPQASEACGCSPNHARGLLDQFEAAVAWKNALAQRRAR